MDKEIKTEIEGLKTKVSQLEKRKPNDISKDLLTITPVTLSDVTGTPNIVFDPTGADAIISNLQTQNNLMNGVVVTLLSSFNTLLNNIKNQ